MGSVIRKRCRIGIVALVVAVMGGTRSAAAAPIASLQYLETNLGGGLFQYDYTLRNLGDPVIDAGADLFDFALFFSDTISLVTDDVRNAAPADWQVIGGSSFLDATSLAPGASPLGADVGPGGMLTGFRFVLDGQIGSTAFEALFVNPTDPAADPIIFDGVTAPAAPVPEPSALLLVATGIGALVSRRGWRR
jgi:hypothetical protein